MWQPSKNHQSDWSLQDPQQWGSDWERPQGKKLKHTPARAHTHSEIYRENQHRYWASSLQLHSIPHSPSFSRIPHSLSFSSSLSQPSQSFICAVALTLVVTMQRQSMMGREKKISQPILKFITTTTTTTEKIEEMEKRMGVRREEEEEERDYQRRWRGQEEWSCHTPSHTHSVVRKRRHDGQMLLHVGPLRGTGYLLHSAEGNQDS